VGGPQTSKALKGQDGNYSFSFPTTDFHTGSAKLKLALAWKVQDRDHLVEEFYEISSRPKVLGLALEPITENILLGQRSAALRFRVQAIGGQNVQMQRDLMSLWISQPANVTLGESEQIYRVNLEVEGDSLVGSLDCPPLPVGSYKLIVSSPVAKLGQDVAASFFNVLPCPVTAKLVSSATGSDTKVVLEGTTTQAKVKGEGIVWALLEQAEGSQKPVKIASADLLVNGKAAGLKWTPEGNGLKSEGLPLEDMAREVTLLATLKDDAERSFEIPMGALTVEPTPLSFSVRWQVAPPTELARGHFIKIRGAVQVTGETRRKRQDAAAAVKNSGVPILSVNPPSALQDFQLVAASGEAGSASPGASAFGEALAFEGMLKASVDDPELRDTLTVEVRSGGREPIEARTVRVGSSGTRLLVQRPAAGESTEVLPFFTRERLQLAIDDQDKGEGKTYRIQVLSVEAGAGTKDGSSAKPVASAAARELIWIPKKEGEYLLEAEALSGEGDGWAAQERLKILPALKLEWSGNIQGAVRLDSGQRLPLFVAVHGADGLEWETFQRLFTLKPQVLAEGGQELAVDFTPWELQKDVSQGVVPVKAFSAKPLTAAAARVRVSLFGQLPAGQAAEAALDVLEVTIMRGGGSLVVVENFEKGPQSYVLRDIVPGFQVPKSSRVRFGYRTSSTASGATPLKDTVAATVVPLDGGPEKVLDIESAAPGLVVFTPYEAGRFGRYKVHLEIKGDQMQLMQEPEFEVTRGTSDWMLVGLAIVVGIILAAGLVLLAILGVQYARDRRFVMARIRSRMDKALTELDSESGESLVGSVRLNVASKTLGPIDLNGNPSHKEVSAWVEQHFSGEKAIFADVAKNEKRRPLIETCLTKARTDLLAEVEKRLPIRAVDVCVREVKDSSGGSQFEAQVVRDRVGSEHEGWKTLLTIALQKDGKLRVSTTAGRTVTIGPGEEFAYNGWIGKSGSQIRASVKVPGVADYSTVMVDVR
jgi:hypothetical protein